MTSFPGRQEGRRSAVLVCSCQFAIAMAANLPGKRECGISGSRLALRWPGMMAWVHSNQAMGGMRHFCRGAVIFGQAVPDEEE